jgi:hypothetical protein
LPKSEEKYASSKKNLEACLFCQKLFIEDLNLKPSGLRFYSYKRYILKDEQILITVYITGKCGK